VRERTPRSDLHAKQRNMLRNFMRGDLRLAEFAITNRCVAKCSFCNIWKQQPKVNADREGALRVIDNLAGMGVGHITLTGGEPLLHPDIAEFVQRCTDRNVHSSVLDACPTLLTAEKLARLDDAGANMISISFDSDDPKVFEESRHIPNIMAELETALGLLGKTGIASMASTLIWKDNHDRMEQLFQKAADIGFDMISVNYPTFSESGIYPLGGEGIALPRERVIESLENVIELKESGRFKIVNQVASMRNIIDYLKDPSTVRYPCFGGQRVMFVDWFFDVRPCMQLPEVLGNMLTMRKDDLRRAPCNCCNMSWYRDFSLAFSGIRGLPAWWELLTSPPGT
jgi:MoaA/NifB/PqqE/SkfB family radical SAM enzyme